jgi:hypothetical protein
MSTSKAAQLLARVDGTLAHVLWGINAIAFPSPALCALCKYGGGMYSVGWLYKAASRGNLTGSPRFDGILAGYLGGGKAITKLGQSFLANLVISLLSTNERGECRLGGMSCFGLGSPGILHAPSPPLQIHGLCYWCDCHTLFVSCQYHQGPKNRQPSGKLP